ncbi:MAG: iron-containing alcohol dehydrogenase [Vicinamibacterales bacterium]
MTSFEFATAACVVFGAGSRRRAGELCSTLGRRVLIVTGTSLARADWLLPLLEERGIAVHQMATAGEPTIPLVTRGAATAREHGCDTVIAVGGGSAIDAGKAIAALATNQDDVFEYLEVIGRGAPLREAPLAFMAIPTTAGTGSEVTRNAVLASPEHRVKVSLRSAAMLPRIALVDSELAQGVPSGVAAASGLDALTQLIEAYVSRRANPMTDALCLAGIPLIAQSIRAACADGAHAEARDAMALGALWSGMALAHAGLGAVHGLAGPIGGMFDAPHGAVCAALVPHVVAANLRALCAEDAGSAAVSRFSTLSRLLSADGNATPAAVAPWLLDLTHELGIPALRTYGMAARDVPPLAARALQSNSMKTNPVSLTEEQLARIVEAAL